MKRPICCFWLLAVICILLSCSNVNTLSWDQIDESPSNPIDVPPPLSPPVPTCPQNCSERGICLSNFTCQCQSQWTGESCQWGLTHLINEKLVNATLIKKQNSPSIVWHYFELAVSNGNQIKVYVSTHACNINLYAKLNHIPSIQDYDYGIQVTSASDLIIDEPEHSKWFFGASSNQNCTFSILANTPLKCPNDCNNNGVCNSTTGKCKCNEHFGTFPDCSVPFIPLSSGNPLRGTVNIQRWIFYTLEVTGNVLDVQFSVLSSNNQKISKPAFKSIRSIQNSKSHSDHGTMDTKFVSQGIGAFLLNGGKAPTLFHYFDACVNMAPGNSCMMHVDNPPQGNWILGIRGNNASLYQVGFVASTICPNSCSNSGQCRTDGTCRCNTFYSSQDCSYYSQPIQPTKFTTIDKRQKHSKSFISSSNIVSDADSKQDTMISISPKRYQYFTYQANANINDLVFSIDQQNFNVSNYYLILLGSCSSQPTIYDYDYIMPCLELRTNSSTCQLEIFGSTNCSWTFAVYSSPSSISLSLSSYMQSSLYDKYEFGSLNIHDDGLKHESTIDKESIQEDHQIIYSINLSAQITCPNDCSGNGVCQAPNGVCNCNPNFGTTSDCSIYMRSLSNGITIKDSISQNQWKYYQLTAHMDTYINFLISNLFGGNIRAFLSSSATLPTSLKYYKSLPSGNQTSYQLSATATSTLINGTWTLGIFGSGSDSASFDVSGYSARDCPQNCSGISNGKCLDGVCQCNPGFVTSDCSATIVPLASNLEVGGRVRFDSWAYYNLSVLGDDAIEIVVQESDNLIIGLVWVFLAKGRIPSIEDNDYANQTISMFHTIRVPSGATRGNWVVGVTGSPRATGSSYLQQAKYNVLFVSGCGTYSSCDTCVLDPNCGWCRNQPFDPAAGRCVPGNDQTSLNQTCLLYQYSTCGLGNDMDLALTRGLIIGVIVGLVIIISASISIFLLYRYWKKLEKTGLRPVVFNEDRPPKWATTIARNQNASLKASSASVDNTSNIQKSPLKTDLNQNDEPTTLPINDLDNVPLETEDQIQPIISSAHLQQKKSDYNRIRNYGAIKQSTASDDERARDTYFSFGADQYTDSGSDVEGMYSSDSEEN